MALSAKHFKALDLIEENSISLTEIAAACGIDISYLRKLIDGKADSGNMGQLFHAEVNKVYRNIDQRNRKRVRKCKDLLLKRLETWARKLPVSKLKDAEVRRVLDAINTINKSTPQVEINSHTQVYNAMTQEDLLNEFKKLKTLARLAIDGTGVSGVGTGTSSEISKLIRQGGAVQKESEDSVLPTSREAGDIPQAPRWDKGDIRGE